MARFGTHTSNHNSDDAHGSRPWVYFMIDCFFLVTQFFVLTFKVKVDEKVLPQQLPPGGTKTNTNPVIVDAQTLRVHITKAGSLATYEFMGTQATIDELGGSLQRVKSAGRECIVRVSYEPNVPFSDVIAVFNTCTRLSIGKCGLVPLRGMPEI